MKTQEQVTKPRSVTLDDERPRPDSPDQQTYVHHLARYTFALRWIQPHHRIFDAGCGTGYGTHLVSRHAAYAVGGDYSPLALEYARANYSNVNLDHVMMDCEQFPLSPGAVDVILCFEVIEHLLDQTAFLKACYDSLRPNGFLVISTPNASTATVHMNSIRMTNEFHVGMLHLDEFRRCLKAVFPHVEIYGQRRRGTRLYSFLRALDVLNLRLRLVPPQRRISLQKQMGVSTGQEVHPQDWIFTKSQLRQANTFVAVCWKDAVGTLVHPKPFA